MGHSNLETGHSGLSKEEFSPNRCRRKNKQTSQHEPTLKNATAISHRPVSPAHRSGETLASFTGMWGDGEAARTYCIIVFCLFSRQLLSSSRILQQVAMSGAFPSGMG